MEGQFSMFDLATGRNNEASDESAIDTENNLNELKYSFDEREEFSEREILSLEKEMLGIYISGHPLYKYSDLISSFEYTEEQLAGTDDSDDSDDTTVVDVKNILFDDAEVKAIGIIKNIRNTLTKKNELMAFVTISGLSANISLTLFPKKYAAYKELLIEGNIVAVKGRISIDSNYGNSILVDSLVRPKDIPRKLWIKFSSENDMIKNLDELQKRYYCEDKRSNIFVYSADTKKKAIVRKTYFDYTDDELKKLQDKYGENNVAAVFNF